MSKRFDPTAYQASRREVEGRLRVREHSWAAGGGKQREYGSRSPARESGYASAGSQSSVGSRGSAGSRRSNKSASSTGSRQGKVRPPTVIKEQERPPRKPPARLNGESRNAPRPDLAVPQGMSFSELRKQAK
jgi:hypothetical protein